MTPGLCNHLFPDLCGCASAAAAPPWSTGAIVHELLFAPPPPAPAIPPPPDVAPAVVAPEPTPAPPELPTPKKGPPPRRKQRGLSTPWGRRAEEERVARERAAADLEARVLELAKTPEGRVLLQKKLDAELARRSFAEFFRQAWKVLEPTTDLVWNWHLTLICCVVQALFFDWLRTKREKGYVNLCRNVIFNVPPGSSKSRVLSVCFQAWAWLHMPGMKFICLSVNDDAMMRDARACRDLIRSKWYVESFQPDWNVKDDQKAASNFGNTAHGDRISLPIKSEIVGLRADCCIIDDPNNPKKAESKNERDEINDLWDTNQYNRVNDLRRSLRIGVQQRTHIADWTGHVIELQGTWSPDNPNGWLHVVLPAEFDPARKFELPEPLASILREQVRLGNLPEEDVVFVDPRTEEKDPIDHERMSRDVLDGERRRWEGTGNFDGQMNQAPALAAGQLVQNSWWGFFRLAGGVRDDIDALDTGRPRPAFCTENEAIAVHGATYSPGEWEFDWIKITVDPAAKNTEKGSNYGLLCVAGKGGRRFVLDDRSQRGAFHEIIEVIKDMIRLWRPGAILIEPKAAGPDLMDTLREQMASGDVPMVSIEEAEPGNTDKEMRLQAALPYIKNGMVYLLDGAPWLEEFVRELNLFPGGLRDDRVDALSQLLNQVRASDDTWPEW